MQVNASQLRTISLALCLEEMACANASKTGSKANAEPIGAAQREAALLSAMHQARQRRSSQGKKAASAAPADTPLQVQEVLLDYSSALVAQASQNQPAIAELHHGGSPWGWWAIALPAISLVLGLVTDRLASLERMDLLSPPLLLLVLWNLLTYLLLAWRALRRQAPNNPNGWLQAPALRGLLAGRFMGRVSAGGWVRRLAQQFQQRWFKASARLWHLRLQQVLHLCAAAWAGGLVLSLLLRGLVVEYQVGWASTFLDAGQVHSILNTLFWPLYLLLPIEPFSLQDIVATQNFAQTGVAGSRWVWLYAGLVGLTVILPRLMLASLTRWRSQHWRTPLDLEDKALLPLRQALPLHLHLGLMNASPGQTDTLQHWLDWHARQTPAESEAAPTHSHSPRGDRLVLHPYTPADTADATNAAAPSAPHQPQPQPQVQAVLALDGAHLGLPPPEWQNAPALNLPWASFAHSWVQEHLCFERLASLLPELAPGITRIAQAWQHSNQQRFAQASTMLAHHLHYWHGKAPNHSSHDAQASQGYAHDYAQALEQLRAQLRHLHDFVDNQSPSLVAQWQLPTHGPALEAPAHPQAQTQAQAHPQGQLPKPPALNDGTLRAVSTSAGAAAGAAAGAKAGAMIDIGTGGLSLGLGTAAGAMLGGATAWVMQDLLGKKKEGDSSHQPHTAQVQAGRPRGRGGGAAAAAG
ncbi:MAG: DUF2868 domain-containing protein, partial [Comamonas sp.]|nr:DUF2868 domain-containing protein [Comamonas sp.]